MKKEILERYINSSDPDNPYNRDLHHMDHVPLRQLAAIQVRDTLQTALHIARDIFVNEEEEQPGFINGLLVLSIYDRLQQVHSGEESTDA